VVKKKKRQQAATFRNFRILPKETVRHLAGKSILI
jgi:hypothetical protein